MITREDAKHLGKVAAQASMAAGLAYSKGLSSLVAILTRESYELGFRRGAEAVEELTRSMVGTVGGETGDDA